MVTIGGNGRSHEIEGVSGASAGGDGGTVRASDSQGGGMGRSRVLGTTSPTCGTVGI